VREEGPLRVRCPGPASAELEAVIVNTAGGVAGGDRFTLGVTVEARARLVVTTAAAEKVYRTLAPEATIDVKLDVAAGGSLAWLPQEAIVFGRSGMGEAVHGSFLFDRWRLRRGGRLMHAEALRLDGAVASRLAQPAVAKGGIAVATVLVVPGDEGTAAGVRALGDRLRGEVGVSAWNGLAAVRLCAADGEALRHDLVAVLAAVRRAPLPRLWLN
jgi:urease accessory protein